VLLAGRAERRGRGDERLVSERLVPELHDVDTAAQRGVEQRLRIVALRPRLEDEVQAGARKALTASGSVHGPRVVTAHVWLTSRRIGSSA